MKLGKKKLSDATKMVIAMILGSVLGIVVGEPAAAIGFIGNIWLNLMKMFLIPIVVCMLVKGISSMDSPETLGRIGVRTLLFYVGTTLTAGVIGLVITSALKPGVGFAYEMSSSDVEIAGIPSASEFFTSMFSSNIFATFSVGDMMQVVIIACVLGVAIVLLPEGKREPVRDWFVAMSDLMMSIIGIALKVAPIGVFCLMASSLGQYGIGLLGTIVKILAIYYLCCVLHWIIAYGVPLWLFTGITPAKYFKKGFETLVAAASMCSSNAVIPVAIDVCVKKFDCRESIASLGIPLGATINKDGVAILCSCVLLFSAQAMGIEMSVPMMLNMLFVTVLVTSAGSGVPGGGLMNLMIVGTAVGMPLDIVIMTGGFYRFFDMGSTSVNCLGDVVVTTIMDRVEKRREARQVKKAVA